VKTKMKDVSELFRNL